MSALRTEMGQSNHNDYSLVLAAGGAWSGNGWYYTPVNTHVYNYYPTGYPLPLTGFYGYDNTLYYSPSDTFRTMQLNYEGLCYSSTMTIFDVGSTNKNFDLIVSGSAADFAGIDYVRFFYGQPWNSDGTTTGSYAPVHEIYVNQSAYDNTSTPYNYNFTYDINRGTKLYCVATAGCY